MRFRFRLESLLNVRRNERDVLRQQYAQAVQAQQLLENQIAQVSDEIADVRTVTRSSAAPGRLNVDRLLQSHRYELLLQVRRQQMQQQLTKVKDEVERRRMALLQGDRDVKLLEKLKERQHASFLQNEMRQEQNRLDEIAQRSTGQAVDTR
jgi:flagellar protein FliJ